jgi:pimeloyl-ACP methyl ester carboxylesterase
MATPPARRTHEVNGVTLSVLEAGAADAPLVLLCHGFPELALSWRHQITALAAAGYRVVAPDMRGYGGSSAPAEIETYSIFHLAGDMVALAGALGAERAAIIGHDWGAAVAWQAALFRPDLFPAVAALSVPFRARGPAAPLAMLRAAGMTRFYWFYFQTPGVAEAEFERDPEVSFRRLFTSGARVLDGTAGVALEIPEKGGFLAKLPDPGVPPPWMDAETFAAFAATYRRTGFRGGLNWYRNIDRNWELTAPWQGAKIHQPALFIAGDHDAVIAGAMGARALAAMPEHVPGLTGSLILPGAGHWVQQERASEVSAALVDFLARHFSADARRDGHRD